MKNIQQRSSRLSYSIAAILSGIMLISSCSKDFLKPNPLSIYEPAATFSTESGLMSAMAICDRHLKLYWATEHNEMLTLGTEYIFSELMVAGATDNEICYVMWLIC